MRREDGLLGCWCRCRARYLFWTGLLISFLSCSYCYSMFSHTARAKAGQRDAPYVRQKSEFELMRGRPRLLPDGRYVSQWATLFPHFHLC